MTYPSDPAYPPAPEQPPPPPRRTGRGVIVAAIAVAAALVISGAGLGAWLLLRDTDRDGPAEPATAVDAFLQAVYQEHDPGEASALVCSEARDEEALAAKIDGIEEFAGSYQEPRFTWNEPEVVDESEQLAVMAVTITMRTTDEKSTEQTLHISVLDKDDDGWWVCNIDTIADEPDEGDPDAGAGDGDGEDDAGEDGDGE